MTSLLRTGALLGAAIVITSAAQAGQFTVESGKTKLLRLNAGAASVIIGNQNVADVAVHDNNLLLISGKSFGTTNLLVLDRDGNTVYSADVVVTTNSANLVAVNRAGQFYTLNCSPQCRDTMQVGDAQDHFSAVIEQLERQKDLNE